MATRTAMIQPYNQSWKNAYFQGKKPNFHSYVGGTISIQILHFPHIFPARSIPPYSYCVYNITSQMIA